MILPSTWYQNNFGYGNSYEVSLNETNPTRTIENVKVGLIRAGEMLSGQSYSILTKNGTVVSSFSNTAGYWTMTPYTNSLDAFVEHYTGLLYNSDNHKYEYCLRPVININSNVTISGGNGTLGHEYIIEVK